MDTKWYISYTVVWRKILLVWRNHLRADDHQKHISEKRSNQLTPWRVTNSLLQRVPIIMLTRNKQWN